MYYRVGYVEIILGDLVGTRSVFVDALIVCTHLIQLTLKSQSILN